MVQIPKTTKAWIINDCKNGFEELKYNKEYPVPELSDHDVLVKINGASLNYRDLVIPHVRQVQAIAGAPGQYPLPQKFPVVAGSDGAGDVVAVGPKVTRFKPGQKVVTLFNQGHLGGSLNPTSIQTGLGGVIDGTIRTHGVFNEEGLVEMPQNLNYLESATLTCAGLTAWNALYGLKQLLPGDWVLTQGTGGVSLFAVQFAKAAGAKVIATTSSKEKEQILKKLGADVIINYRENPEWGVMAKKATTDGQGVAHVVEVGGPQTMAQSLEAVKIDGIITIIGFVAKGNEPQPSFLECLSKGCTARGLLVGSRDQFEAMNRAIVANNIHPVLDQKVFTLDDARAAYDYQWAGKHVGKVCIKID